MQFHVRTYKTKPVVIESVLLTASNMEATRKWCGGIIENDVRGVKRIELDTESGVDVAELGEYIVKYPHGGFEVLNARKFNLMYELTPHEVARDSDLWPEKKPSDKAT